jgi:rRNA-processing protein FCF1
VPPLVQTELEQSKKRLVYTIIRRRVWTNPCLHLVRVRVVTKPFHQVLTDCSIPPCVQAELEQLKKRLEEESEEKKRLAEERNYFKVRASHAMDQTLLMTF